jgi:hypothetical protein
VNWRLRWLGTALLSVLFPVLLIVAMAWFNGSYLVRAQAGGAFLAQIEPLLGSAESPLPRYAEAGRQAVLFNQSSDWLRVTHAWRGPDARLPGAGMDPGDTPSDVVLGLAGVEMDGREIYRQSDLVTVRFLTVRTTVIDEVRRGATRSLIAALAFFTFAMAPVLLWTGHSVMRQDASYESEMRELQGRLDIAQSERDGIEATAHDVRQRLGRAESEIVERQHALRESEQAYALMEEVSAQDAEQIASDRDRAKDEVDEALQLAQLLETELQDTQKQLEDIEKHVSEQDNQLATLRGLPSKSKRAESNDSWADGYLSALSGCWGEGFRSDLIGIRRRDRGKLSQIQRVLIRIDYGLMPGEPKIVRGLEALRAYEYHVGREYRLYFQREAGRNRYLLVSPKTRQDTDVQNRIRARAQQLVCQDTAA